MALASFALLALTEGNFAQQRGPARRVLIGFKDGTGRQAIEGRRALIRGRGGEVRRSYRFLPTVSAELPEAQISSLRADPRVAYIEEDGLVHALDAELDNSWGVKRIGAGNVHPSNKGTGVKVAIIDTGIDYTHPDLDANYKEIGRASGRERVSEGV
jgi:subtilisin